MSADAQRAIDTVRSLLRGSDAEEVAVSIGLERGGDVYRGERGFVRCWTLPVQVDPEAIRA